MPDLGPPSDFGQWTPIVFRIVERINQDHPLRYRFTRLRHYAYHTYCIVIDQLKKNLPIYQWELFCNDLEVTIIGTNKQRLNLYHGI